MPSDGAPDISGLPEPAAAEYRPWCAVLMDEAEAAYSVKIERRRDFTVGHSYGNLFDAWAKEDNPRLIGEFLVVPPEPHPSLLLTTHHIHGKTLEHQALQYINHRKRRFASLPEIRGANGAWVTIPHSWVPLIQHLGKVQEWMAWISGASRSEQEADALAAFASRIRNLELLCDFAELRDRGMVSSVEYARIEMLVQLPPSMQPDVSYSTLVDKLRMLASLRESGGAGADQIEEQRSQTIAPYL